ncbi:plasmid replication protein RepC [Mangrovicoccus sp. HB161399]|uniref:plasmid replication protein RepC n=1 Tax=Mangrovicoccus sp. HB161399 TaxID=2720392 RepID=UPI001551B0BC|nr:plasmid replication protein RepC [Mangrovicoccus sp. HB161399]
MIHQTFPADARDTGQARQVRSVRGTGVPAAASWHKWRQILPALRLARGALGLNRSRLDLIEKLMACIPGDLLATGGDGELIVHVSNARLAQMTNRDGDKTVTRLISELSALGLLARKSSPNGKRYMRQAPDGSRTAFGLDLAPLLDRMPGILRLAHAAEQEAEACRRLRESCSLMMREIGESEDTAELLHEARKTLRRKPVRTDLQALKLRLATCLPARETASGQPERTLDRGPDTETASAGGSAPQNGRHKYPAPNLPERYAVSGNSEPPASPASTEDQAVDLTPEMVETAMPRVANVGRNLQAPLRDLVEHLVLSLGITGELWRSTVARLGFTEAALLAMVLYERQAQLRNPPGYLRSLLQSEPADVRLGSRMLRLMVHR